MSVLSLYREARVVATTRNPDGTTYGKVDGLIVDQSGFRYIVTLANAIGMAGRSLLWCIDPWGGHRVRVVPVDEDGDGLWDFVRTAPDTTVANNLLELPIFVRSLQTYVTPRTGAQVSA